MANILPIQKQLDILQLHVEGNSISSIHRFTGVHRDTIGRHLIRFGNACKKFLDRELCDLDCQRLQIDEIWTFVGINDLKRCNSGKDIESSRGSFYLFVALEEQTKLVPAFRLGKRDDSTTNAFIKDLFNRLCLPKPASSEERVIHISTDSWRSYEPAIRNTFKDYASYGQLKKKFYYEGGKKIVEMTRTVFTEGIEFREISTSLVERNNLTIRTLLRRFTRETIAFSRKLEVLEAAITIFFAYYNYCWKHRTIKTTPAVAARVVRRKWRLRELYDHVRQCAPEFFLGA